jgi:hypothetical protein
MHGYAGWIQGAGWVMKVLVTGCLDQNPTVREVLMWTINIAIYSMHFFVV